MKRKLFCLSIAFITIFLCSCQKPNVVESWQSASEFGQIEESEDINLLYKWGTAHEDLLIDKYINIEEENRYRQIDVGVFESLWNYYADNEFKIKNWKIEEDGDNKFYDKTVRNKNYSIYIHLIENNNNLISAEITLSNNLTKELSCKYSTLIYYILCPFESKFKINNDIENIYENEEITMFNTSAKKNLKITSEEQKGGHFIKFYYEKIQ